MFFFALGMLGKILANNIFMSSHQRGGWGGGGGGEYCC